MKALKILGGVVAALVLGVGVFYAGWLRAPEPEEVCENLARVAKKESGVELSTKEQRDCIRRAQPPEFGRVPWVKQMKCLRDADSKADLDQCST